MISERSPKEMAVTNCFLFFLGNTLDKPFFNTNPASSYLIPTRPAITCSKLKIETLGQCVKYVQS